MFLLQTLGEMENQENHTLLELLQYGRELYQEIQRKLFTVSSEEAERLINMVEQFIIYLIILSRQLLSYHNIIIGVSNTVREFQRLVSRLEERFKTTNEDELQYVCPSNDGNQKRGRPKLLIPKEQLEGLRSLGFSWSSVAEMLGVSEKTPRRRRDAYGISSVSEEFMQISDEQLCDLVKPALNESPNSGERMVMGYVRGKDTRSRGGEFVNQFGELILPVES